MTGEESEHRAPAVHTGTLGHTFLSQPSRWGSPDGAEPAASRGSGLPGSPSPSLLLSPLFLPGLFGSTSIPGPPTQSCRFFAQVSLCPRASDPRVHPHALPCHIQGYIVPKVKTGTYPTDIPLAVVTVAASREGVILSIKLLWLSKQDK